MAEWPTSLHNIYLLLGGVNLQAVLNNRTSTKIFTSLTLVHMIPNKTASW